MKEIAVIVSARNHKAFNPESMQHKKFLIGNIEKIKKLSQVHSHLDFTAELDFFNRDL
jgi:hypothetical protein